MSEPSEGLVAHGEDLVVAALDVVHLGLADRAIVQRGAPVG